MGGTRKYSSTSSSSGPRTLSKAKSASETKAPKKRTASRDKVSKSASKPGLQIPRYFTERGVDPFTEVEWELRTASITGESGKICLLYTSRCV